MRTTLDIDDRVLQAARELAHARQISLGAAVSALARRGLEQSSAVHVDLVFPTLQPIVDHHLITDEIVAEHRDDQ